ncbi:MAG TPA: hypothetical protein VMV80_03820 [Anaerolineales bacterium]|nr:hypothetical protein [Anaerolineales bacterium]
MRFTVPRWQREYRAPLSAQERQELRQEALRMGFISIEDERLSSLERDALAMIIKRVGRALR